MNTIISTFAANNILKNGENRKYIRTRILALL